jgi:hypothetical protein
MSHRERFSRPQPGQIAVSVQSAPTVGEVMPVYVSIANGTSDTPTVVPSQIFAPNAVGEPGCAAATWRGPARRATPRNSKERCKAPPLAASWEARLARRGGRRRSCPQFSVAAGFFGSPSSSALVGAGFGSAWGTFTGAELGESKADQQTNQEIETLSLQHQEVRRDFTINGYVFFPKGEHSQVEIVLVDRECRRHPDSP